MSDGQDSARAGWGQVSRELARRWQPGPWGLGTWLFGWDTSAEEAERLMGAALDHGITYFDTANNYGRGRSEQIVGAFLAPVRDEVVISTKVYAPFGPRPADRGLSADAVRRATEISLRRLGTDRIDLLLLHRPDPDVPAEETAGALAELVTEGKVLRIGTSTFRNHQLDALQQALAAVGAPPAVCDQAPYSMLERAVEHVAAAALDRWDMGVVAWSPLAEGLLTGKYADPSPSGRLLRWSVDDEPRFRAGLERAHALRSLADELGTGLTQLALAWLRARPMVDCILIGARNTDQLGGYLASESVQLDPRVEPYVDDLVSPGGSVLNHYDT